jgi:type III pantothenate kinase
MILCIDIGNTRIKGSLTDGNSFSESFAFPSPKESDPSFVENIFQEKIIVNADRAVYSSVVPGLADIAGKVLVRKTGAPVLRVSPDIRLPFEIRYDDPSKLGTDRISSACGAWAMFPGTDMIVVDCGTAVTFGVLLSEGVFDGGLIAPGHGIAAEAIGAKADQLFRVDVTRPERVSARNTADALRSGLYYGWVSLVEGIADRLCKEYNRDFKLILTGGGAKTLAGDIRCFAYDELLLFKGLYHLHTLNP